MDYEEKNYLPNAFTILEMMIVMAVIAILLLITLPNIQQNLYVSKRYAEKPIDKG